MNVKHRSSLVTRIAASLCVGLTLTCDVLADDRASTAFSERLNVLLDKGDITGKLVEQGKPMEKWSPEELRRVISQNMERSYFTASSGFLIDNDQTSRKILFEGQLFLNLDACQGEDWWIDVPVRVVVRMLKEDSLPVFTPSYNPGFRFYCNGKARACPTVKNSYWSLGLHHYSNGQVGEALLPDGSVNTRDGSFSTNYLETAWHGVFGWDLLQWGRLSLRLDNMRDWDEAQDKQYGRTHVAWTHRTKYFQYDGLAMQVTASLIHALAGRDYVIYNRGNPSVNIKADAADNWGLTIEMMVPLGSISTDPKNPKSGLGFYVRYDRGFDYYNINFQHKMNRLQVGVVSTNF